VDLRVFGVHTVLELAPVLLAVDRLSGGKAQVSTGGVAHLGGAGRPQRQRVGSSRGSVAFLIVAGAIGPVTVSLHRGGHACHGQQRSRHLIEQLIGIFLLCQRLR
jgi:hypothetical protein